MAEWRPFLTNSTIPLLCSQSAEGGKEHRSTVSTLPRKHLYLEKFLLPCAPHMTPSYLAHPVQPVPGVPSELLPSGTKD
jgi:hypothetical protein